MSEITPARKLFDLLVTRDFDPEMLDTQGKPAADPAETDIFSFDFRAESGKNYGTIVIMLGDDKDLEVYCADNVGRTMEGSDKDDWFAFLEQLKNFATRNFMSFGIKNLNRLRYSMQGQAAIKEGLFEGYYGTRKISYMGEETDARLVIRHNRILGEEDKRFRYVESLFIETADQERFKLSFKNLAGGRAMLEHVRQGGRPYDARGNHITEIVSEMAVLSRFNRAQHNRVFEGVTQQLVESAREYYANLQETLKHLGSPRGYQGYFESWAPDHIGEAEALVENLRDLFVEQTLDARIEAALPTLAKIQQGTKMKEAKIFENWVDQISEGTWSLPDTPEAQEKLNELMASELIVGPDATNATEQLYDVIGDDQLFDILNDLADRDPRANIWDDSDVQERLAELGIQTPQSTAAEPADVDQDTAPELNEEGEISMSNPGQLSNQEYKDSLNRRYGQPDLDTSRMNQQTKDFYDKNPSFKQSGKEIVSPGDGRLASKVVPAVTDTKAGRIRMNTPGGSGRAGGSMSGPMGGMKPGQSSSLDNPIQNEDELAEMLRRAGLSMEEGSNQGGVWSASPPKPGQPNIAAPSGDPEGAPSTPKTASPGWGKDYKPLTPDTTKGPAMGINKGGVFQADPKGTIKAPGGDPESVKEDDADPFNDPFFNAKSQSEPMIRAQQKTTLDQGKGTSLKAMNPIDRDQYLNNTGRAWDEKTQRSVPAVKTTTTPITTTNEADPRYNNRGLDYPPLEGGGPGLGSGGGSSGSWGGGSGFRSSFNRAKDISRELSTSGASGSSVTAPTTTQAAPLGGLQNKVPGALRVGTSDRPPTVTPAGSTPKLPANYEQPAVMRGRGDPNFKADFDKTAKPRITVKPGESMKDAIQRTQTEKEFGDFLKGQSGQQFGTKTNDTKVFNPATDPLGNASAIDESLDSLRDVLRNAGVTVTEGVLTDSTGSTLEHIKDTFKRDVKDFVQSGEMSDHLFQALYDYYFDDMPYAIRKAKDEHQDPYQWVSDRFAEDMGLEENLIAPMIEPVAECNYTMEGDYCPEHGLAECGGMSYGLGEELSRLKELATGQINNVNGAETSPVQAPTDIKSTDLDPAPFVVDVSGIGNLTHDDSDTPFKVDVRGFGPDPEDLPAGNKLVKPMQPLVREVDEGNNDPMMSRLKTLAGFMVK